MPRQILAHEERSLSAMESVLDGREGGNEHLCAKGGKAMWDYSGMVEVTIDRPARDVWPFFFGTKKDMWTEANYKTVAGQSGQVGEVYVMAYQGASVPQLGDQAAPPRAQLAFEAIKVNPEKQLVLKITFKEHENAAWKLCGYDFVTVKEVSGGTTVVLQQALELPVEPNTNLAVETERHDSFLAGIFQTLKRMVEQS